MNYLERLDLKLLKKRSGLRSRDLASLLHCAPTSVNSKIGGYMHLSDAEAKVVRSACLARIKQNEKNRRNS